MDPCLDDIAMPRYGPYIEIINLRTLHDETDTDRTLQNRKHYCNFTSIGVKKALKTELFYLYRCTLSPSYLFPIHLLGSRSWRDVDISIIKMNF